MESSNLVAYGCTAWTVAGVATVRIRSAMTANSSIGSDSWHAAKTCWAVVGRRETNNSRKSLSSIWCSPMSRWSLRRNCVGWLSSSSSSESNSLTRFCSEICVRWIRRLFNVLYGFSTGGARIKSRTSAAYSGDREAITWWNRVDSLLMRLVVNTDSICANQIWGSDAQYGGSLIAKATGATSDDEEMLFASSPVFAVVDTCCCGCCCCCCCCSASNCSWSLLCWLIIVLTSSGCDNLPDEGGVLSAAAWRGVASCFSMCPRPALAEPGGWAGVVMLPLRLGETIFFFFFFKNESGSPIIAVLYCNYYLYRNYTVNLYVIIQLPQVQWRSQFLAHVERERLLRSEDCNQKRRRERLFRSEACNQKPRRGPS